MITHSLRPNFYLSALVTHKEKCVCSELWLLNQIKLSSTQTWISNCNVLQWEHCWTEKQEQEDSPGHYHLWLISLNSFGPTGVATVWSRFVMRFNLWMIFDIYPGLFLISFSILLIYDGLGFWVLDWVFGVGVINHWCLEPLVWVLLGFWGLGLSILT